MSPMTQAVKDELVQVYPRLQSSALAEISAMFRFGGGIQIQGGDISVSAELAHAGAAHHLGELVRTIFKIEPEIQPISTNMRQGNQFIVTVRENGERFARKIGLLDSHGRLVRGISPVIVGGSKEDACAAWRGAFLARGTLMEPGRNSGLEVVCPSLEAAYGIGGLARRLGITYRARESRGAFRVDIREGDAISEILTRMGASDAVVQWEQLRVEREVHGSVNRLANFDDANMRRSADAAVIAVIRVKRAFEILGDDIPANLREAGEFRVRYPEDSLNGLGEKMEPKATKDAVAGRLRRLNSMADKRAAELGVPNTMDAVREIHHSY
ncbi:MAG: DNA-binding protein WhiA [Actinomycetaceae bacterium]|nr:DNA-binding protein WhiA [Actinomycetaceae bacterium]